MVGCDALVSNRGVSVVKGDGSATARGSRFSVFSNICLLLRWHITTWLC
jgi:hypothetical protein